MCDSLKLYTSKRLCCFFLIIHSPTENSVPTVHDQLVLMVGTVCKSETIFIVISLTYLSEAVFRIRVKQQQFIG